MNDDIVNSYNFISYILIRFCNRYLLEWVSCIMLRCNNPEGVYIKTLRLLGILFDFFLTLWSILFYTFTYPLMSLFPRLPFVFPFLNTVYDFCC